MKHRLGMGNVKKPLADHLPTVTLKAKDFATALTNHNISAKNLSSESSITYDHTKNNQNVRKLLLDEGVIPEQLPPAEDVAKIKRRLKNQEKKILKEMKPKQ
jgi:DNA-damage-inducible protein D